MRLKPSMEFDREALRKLKPVTGDVILFGNEKYVVTTVGLRYLHAYKLGENPRAQFLLRNKDIVKTGEKA